MSAAVLGALAAELQGDAAAFWACVVGEADVADAAFVTRLAEPLATSLARMVLYTAIMAVALVGVNVTVVPVVTAVAGIKDELEGRKVAASCRELCFYAVTAAATMRVYWGVERVWWNGAHGYDLLYTDPATGENSPVDDGSRVMRVTYYTELGWYCAGIILLLIEVRRKDFAVMMAHHFVTIGLLLLSWWSGWFSAGVAVLLVHNSCDVLLQLAKVFNYCDMEKASLVTFVGLLASWALLRLYAYPQIFLVAFTERYYDWLWCHGLKLRSQACIVLLMCLYPMHVYWFSQMLRVAYMAVSKGKVADVRETDLQEQGEQEQQQDKGKEEGKKDK